MAVPDPTRNPRRRWRRNLGIALLGATVTSVFFINFCNLVYQCGCRSLWNGADAHCNIHMATARHCPWCSIGMPGATAIWATIVLAQFLVAFRYPSMPPMMRIAGTLAAFPLVGGILALGVGLYTGYWN